MMVLAVKIIVHVSASEESAKNFVPARSPATISSQVASARLSAECRRKTHPAAALQTEGSVIQIIVFVQRNVKT